MATLTLTVGAFTAQITAGNAAAARVLGNVVESQGYAGDPNDETAKLQFALDRVRDHWVGISKNHEAKTASQVAYDAAFNDPANNWT